MTVLGIETSCDETSAAVMSGGRLRSNVISSQYFHSAFGGVVPELASRAHLRAVVPIVREALDRAGIGFADLELCAATQGPGLIGSLLVGLNAAKGIASALGIPLIPVHHVEAHMFSVFLSDPHPSYPFLCLVVSGGHTLVVRVRALGEYDLLGSTRDDAAGEAFDKVAKMLGLGFPGGPAIERLAREGDPEAIRFPRGMDTAEGFDFSFSGIKTSVLYYLRKRKGAADAGAFLAANPRLAADVAASFQRAVIDTLTARIFAAAEKYAIRDIAVVGGVSANSELARMLKQRAEREDARIFIPAGELSTDNAAMVAWLGARLWEMRPQAPSIISAFARSPHFSFS